MNRRDFVSVAIASQAPFRAASDTIRVAALGVGGRCRGLLRALAKIPGAQVVGFADVWDQNLALTREFGVAGALRTKEYRELLDRKDVDAVLIASPDHWHAPMTIDACGASKDVYVEKPLTHSIAEGPRVIEAQNRSGRVVQVGMQQRSMPHLIEAREIIRSGKLGRIHKVHMTWNRNTPRGRRGSYGIDPASVDWNRFLGSAPRQPFDEYRFRQWRWFWDFGNGILTDLMVHWLDVVHWFLELDHPETAVTIGDHFSSQGWETPDTIQTLLHYPKQQVQAYFEGTFVNQRNAAMTEFMGTEATLYIDRGRYEIHPERKRGSDGALLPDSMRYSEKVLGHGPRGADFYNEPDGEMLHLAEWLKAVRERRRPNTPAEAGVSAAAAAHLGNISYRAGKLASFPATSQ